jgi:hypothetical protein
MAPRDREAPTALVGAGTAPLLLLWLLKMPLLWPLQPLRSVKLELRSVRPPLLPVPPVLALRSLEKELLVPNMRS